MIGKVLKDKLLPQNAASVGSQSTAAGLRELDIKQLNEQLVREIRIVEMWMDNPLAERFITWTSGQQSAYLAAFVNELFKADASSKPAQKLKENLGPAVNARLADLTVSMLKGDTSALHVHMRDIVKTAALQIIGAEEADLSREKREMEARTITLHDGRHAYVDGDNYRDDNGQLLQGKDFEEARQKDPRFYNQPR